MNRRKPIIAVVTGGFATLLLGLAGCNPHTQSSANVTIDSLSIDTTVVLNPKAKLSPTCQVKLSLMFLHSSDNADTLTQKINRALLQAVSDKTDASLAPTVFADSLKMGYINGYKQDIQEFYDADLKRGMTEKEIPAWYSYAYSTTTTLAKGKEGIWNYTVTNFQNTGGAHPNTWSKWINIKGDNGQVLTKQNVFLPNTDKAVCQLIMKRLIEEANSRLDTDTITSLEGLRSVGALLEGDLYVPDNFRLGQEGITFLYNPYDIAPYSMGAFELTVPYTELKNYLVQK